jgi:uncharacterized membrane protein
MKKMTTVIILVLTALTTALITGLFYAYSCSINPGLGKLSDAEYISAMQSINKAILNPLFFLSFMGTLFLLPLSAYLNYHSSSFLFLIAAALVYIIGTFGVTIFGNVPLNNALEGFNLQSASAEAVANARAKFEGPWNRLHSIRTFASVVALVLVIVALIRRP